MKEYLSFGQAAKTCIKCSGVMTAGFIADFTYGDSKSSIMQNVWVEGKYERTWTGAKLKDNRKFVMTTFRCATCGFLESYALEETSK